MLYASIRAKNYGLVLAQRDLTSPLIGTTEDGTSVILYQKSEISHQGGEEEGSIWDDAGAIGGCLRHALNLKPGEKLCRPLEFKQKLKGVSKTWAAAIPPAVYHSAATGSHHETTRVKTFRSLNFKMYTIRMENKLSVSSLDVKRYILSCSRHSLAYGHKDIELLAQKGDRCHICDE